MKPFFTLLFIFLLSTLYAQMPDVAWQMTIGGEHTDMLESVLLTDDGGYLLGGSSKSGISCEKGDTTRGFEDFWVVKLDSEREIEWQKTIGGNSSDLLKDMIILPDGGYLLAGSSGSSISGEKTENGYGDFDYWIVKIDTDGNVIWDKTIGGNDLEKLTGCVLHNDTSIVLGGISKSNASGLKADDSEGEEDFWIVNISLDGELNWQNTIGGDSSDFLFSIEKTLDNGFILGGDTRSGISADKLTPLTGIWDFWMVKLDEEGNHVWDRSIGGDTYCAYGVATQSNDGNYIMAGSTTCGISGIKSEEAHGDIAYWALKFDESGTLIWENTIGGNNHDYLVSIIKTLDNGILLGGHSKSDSSFDKMENPPWLPWGSKDIWLVKLSEDGEVEWENTLFGRETEEPTSLIQITENEYIVGGFSSSSFGYDKQDQSRGANDYWLIKLDICPPINNSVTTTYIFDLPINLTADAEGYDYQWYDCGSNKLVELPGRTDQSLNRDYYDDGYYTVKISDGECSVFSDCHFLKYHLSLEENEVSKISIYPNPTTDLITIDYQDQIRVDIVDITGQVLISTDQKNISLSSIATGIYWVKIYNAQDKLISINRIVRIE